MKNFRWDKKYLHWGVTAFCVIAASILFYMLVSNLVWLRNALRDLGTILSPFIWGLVIAYLLYPLLKIYSQYLFTPLCKRLLKNSKKAETRIPAVARGLSVFLCVISLIVIVGGLIWLVAPQLYNSVEHIVVNSSDYITRLDDWLTRMLADYPEIEQTVSSAVGDLSNGVVTWATNYLLPRLSGLLNDVSANVISFFRGIYNIIIGVIVSVYVMYSKETFGARCKKLIYCIFSLEASEKILNAVQFTNQVFMGFLSGKILDSLIIGFLCFIGCSILRMPYALLVSVIVGLFNIIPFFGPIIGAIPTTLIILTESPLKALIFLIFVIVLQQFDGNILGPKILGNRVGINGFWVMFAIILGAGLFGFAGMLLGVPVFVVIYTFIKNLVEHKLERSGLPAETAEYMDIGYIDPRTGRGVSWSDENRRSVGKKKVKKVPAKPEEGPAGEDEKANGGGPKS